VPIALVTFLVALAIVDDLGAVLVIAVFYTDQIHLLPLVMAGMSFLIYFILRKGFSFLLCNIIYYNFVSDIAKCIFVFINVSRKSILWLSSNPKDQNIFACD
jgi:Na+/H+ antiporter NhaA